MKKSHLVKRGVQDAVQLSSQPDKVGWIRKFCGKGIFRKIWRNRFVMLKGEHLYIFEKEMKNNGKTHEVFDLAEYEQSLEVRKAKSRSKKNHSKFTLLRCRQPGTRTSNLVFLAVSPEEKESWINVLNAAISRAKNRVLDEVTIEEESLLSHPTRDRAKIPLGRRLPTRGHLMAVASSTSDGMLTLDLVHEEDADLLEHDEAVWVKDHRGNLDLLAPARKRADTDVSRHKDTTVEAKVKTSSLPRESEISWSHPSQTHTPQHETQPDALGKSYCGLIDNVVLSVEHGCTHRELFSRQISMDPCPTSQLQDMINLRLQRAQEILAEIQEQELKKGKIGIYQNLRGVHSPRLCPLKSTDSPKSISSSSHGSSQVKIGSPSQVKAKNSPGSKIKDLPYSKSKSSKSHHFKDQFCSKSIDSSNSDGSNSPNMKCLDLTQIKLSNSPISPGNNSPCLKDVDSPSLWFSCSPHNQGTKGIVSPFTELLDWERKRAAAERLLQEAVSSWVEAREVLAQVKELQTRQQQKGPNKPEGPLTQESKPES